MPSVLSPSQASLSRTTGQPANLPVVLHTRVVSGTGGGPDKTILNSPRFLVGAYRTLCAYMHPPGDPGFEELRKKAQLWQAPLLSVPDRGPWDWRVLRQLLDICRTERVTIWHGHDYKSNVLGLMLRPFWPMHLVTTVHGWVKETRRTPLYYGIDRLCLPHYERVICVSEDLHARCRAARVPEDRCRVIENAIDTEAFRRQRTTAEAKQNLGLRPDSFLIGAVGRLSPEKGFDLLIRATDLILKTYPEAELVVIGEGEEQPRLQALIQSLQRTDRIRLLGYRADTHALYEAMDVFALSSVREGLPNVVLEAMAMEVPVVATQIAGVPRLVQHDQNGLLVQPNNVESLVSALTRIITDGVMRNRLGMAGRQTIETRYSFEVRMKKVRALYDDLTRPDLSPR